MTQFFASFRAYGLLTVAGLIVGACGNNGDSDQDRVSVQNLTTEERLALPANAANGERLFLVCAVCHDVDPDVGHRVGPNLWEVHEAPVARHRDFAYSKALRESGIIWTEENLDAYLTNPYTMVPRGRMAYVGEPDPANRRDMIAYLKTLK